MAKKRQHCEFECERQIRAMERQREAEAEERARDDGFERYR